MIAGIASVIGLGLIAFLFALALDSQTPVILKKGEHRAAIGITSALIAICALISLTF